VRERVFLGEQRPIAIERPRIKEADPAVIGFEGTTRDTTFIPQMEEIGANLLLAEHVGRAHVVGGEPADCLDVHVLGPRGETSKPHVIDHTLTQRGHGILRSGSNSRSSALAPVEIHQTAAMNPPPTAKPFSPTVDELSKAD
jgi:hypothetical protein